MTVGTIYFTVIPLYQKALLDEEIARKEIELKAVKESLDSVYKTLRGTLVSGFVFYAGPKCSGLLEPIVPPDVGNARSATVTSHQDNLLSRDIWACIMKEAAEDKGLKMLRPSDHMIFDTHLARLEGNLRSLRDAAQSTINEIPSRAKSDPESLPPPQHFMRRTLDYLSRLSDPATHNQRVLDARISSARSDILDKYHDDIRSELTSLWDIQWAATE